jgi:hypothetical protein
MEQTAMTDARDRMRWVARGGALAALVLGWLFIAWQNHFRLTAPMVFVGLAYLAVVATIYNLWRTGVAVVDSEEEADSTWVKPAGALGELEREKRTLLKAIKEAEFDHQMGKLSKRDADEMIRVYRARAIEVIKDIDRLGHGAAGSPREQILREVRARLELEGKSQKKTADARAKAEKTGNARPRRVAAAATDPAAAASVDAADAADAAPDATGASPSASAADAASDATSEASGDAASEAASERGEAVESATAARARAALDDDMMDADSTTTVEPSRDGGKEATP